MTDPAVHASKRCGCLVRILSDPCLLKLAASFYRCFTPNRLPSFSPTTLQIAMELRTLVHIMKVEFSGPVLMRSGNFTATTPGLITWRPGRKPCRVKESNYELLGTTTCTSIRGARSLPRITWLPAPSSPSSPAAVRTLVHKAYV